jgi:hypothetical protein
MSFLGVAFASVGALLVVRRPGNAVGWCMVLIGAGYALGMLAAAVTFSAVADGPAGSGTARVAAWLTVLFTTIGGLVFGLGLIFPTGRGHTPGWDRFVRLLAVALPFGSIILFLIRPGPLHLFPDIDNPIGVGPDLRAVLGDRVSEIIAASAGLVIPVVALSMASRYRMSDAVGRQQLKWFILALMLSIAGVAVASVGALISEEPPSAGLALFGFVGALVPVAIGIAILRHGLYDIDRIISRTIVYTSVTGILFGLFVVVNLALQAWLSPRLGGGGSIATAASTLLVAALFSPVRGRVQQAVDRRFDRARYDAEQTVAALAEILRDEVDLAVVGAAVTDVIARSVAPEATGLWLRQRSTR